MNHIIQYSIKINERMFYNNFIVLDVLDYSIIIGYIV